MRNVRLALALLLSLTALPLAAQTGTWTAVASTGAVDEASAGLYQFGGAGFLFRLGSTGSIVARYNVTNTFGGGLSDIPNTPPWSTLELTYSDSSPAGSVQADLIEIEPCTGVRTVVCTVTSVDATTPTCGRCSFNSSLDFGNKLYYVEVTVSRTSGLANPIATALRIY